MEEKQQQRTARFCPPTPPPPAATAVLVPAPAAAALLLSACVLAETELVFEAAFEATPASGSGLALAKAAAPALPLAGAPPALGAAELTPICVEDEACVVSL